MNAEPPRLSISRSNSKIGPVPSVSLPPLASCPSSAPSSCSRHCYALRLLRLRPSWNRSLASNWLLWLSDPLSYFDQLDSFLSTFRPAHFRFHVSGDIPSPRYLSLLLELVRSRPSTLFLTYTASPFRPPLPLPYNLSYILSSWALGPSPSLPPKYPFFPSSTVFSSPSSIPLSYSRCPGSCPQCSYLCWTCSPHAEIAFLKH